MSRALLIAPAWLGQSAALKMVCRLGLCKVVALPEVTPNGVQELLLSRLFDAFGHDLDLHGLGKRNDGAHEGGFAVTLFDA